MGVGRAHHAAHVLDASGVAQLEHAHARHEQQQEQVDIGGGEQQHVVVGRVAASRRGGDAHRVEEPMGSGEYEEEEDE